jgi:glyoxylase-like metal-dependent hydrolase (beta-lactamase superfamily II)
MTDIKSFSRPSLPVLNRREALLGAASLAGAAAWPGFVWAQAVPHTFKQGDFEVTVVSDGHLLFPASAIAPDAPPEELKSLLQAAGQLEGENAVPAANAVLVRSGSDLILFDTGSGPGFQPTAGKLPESLAAAGVEPAQITKIVFTHGHLDHIGGTTAEGGALRYPNASYFAAAAEWDFWMDPTLISKMPAEMHGFITGAQQNLGAVKDRVTMLKPGDDIVTGIRLLDTAGHTPGHVSIEVAGGEGLIIVADAAVNPVVFFEHPEWRFSFDAIPELAVDNRKKLLDRAAADKIKLLGFHWKYPGVGFAERKDAVYRYVPV